MMRVVKAITAVVLYSIGCDMLFDNVHLVSNIIASTLISVGAIVIYKMLDEK